MTTWDLDLRPLSPGGGEVWVRADASTAVHWVRFDGRVHQLGAPPGDRYTVGMVTTSDYPLRWNGRLVCDDDVEVFAPGQEYESCGPEGFGAFTVSVDRAHLDRKAQLLRVPTISAMTNDKPWVARTQRAQLLHRFKKTIAQHLAHRGSTGVLDDVVESLLLMLQQSAPRTAPLPRRRQVFKRAMEAIQEIPRGENPSVGSICQTANCSFSTLERAFRDQVGIGPKAYVNALRLNGVRRELMATDGEDRVADVAARWGFWHMGKFAADYRRAFGELPSVTLNASRARLHA